MLTGWLLDRLAGSSTATARRSSGCTARQAWTRRGGTVALNFLDPDGRLIDERAVATGRGAAGISLRTGCFCNPGAGEWALGLSKRDVRGPWWLALAGGGFLRKSMTTVDDYLEVIGLETGGAVRVSLGLASNVGGRGGVPRLRRADLP